MAHRSSRIFLSEVGRQTWAAHSPEHELWRGFRVLGKPELWFVWGGRGKIRTRESSHPIAAGVAVFLLPGREYEVTQDPDCPLSVNFFVFDIPDLRPFLGLPTVMEHVDFNFFEGATRRVLELAWEEVGSASPASPVPRFTDEEEYVRTGAFCPNPIGIELPRAFQDRLAVRLALAVLEDYAHRATACRPAAADIGIDRAHREAISGAVARIRREPGAKWSVAELARGAGYGQDHFSRLFQRVLGCPPKVFLLNCRIAEARRLLAESGLTVKEISVRLDYSSPGFFSRQFKSLTGFTPEQFRASSAAERE